MFVPHLTTLFSPPWSSWAPLVIHYCPLTTVQVSWLGLSNEVNTPLMWKLDTTMWWRQTGSSRVNRETRGPFDVGDARLFGTQKASGRGRMKYLYVLYMNGCTLSPCVSVRGRQRKRQKGKSVFTCEWERYWNWMCVCARMKLILPGTRVTSFIQWMKWVRKWQLFGK